MIIELAGIKVDNITLDESIEKLKELVSGKTPHLIVTPNPEMIVASQKDQELKEIINTASLRLPDGISMVVVSRILGKPLKERVSGIDFLIKACELSSKSGWKIFLFGGAEGIAKKAGEKLKEKYPKLQIIGTYQGYFQNDSEIITLIKNAKPDILFAGLGAVRQEKWLAKYLNELKVPVCVGIGGSFDVISGEKKRAPEIFQKLCIEWLYRLITEPSRWRRQLALPKFLWLAFTRNML